MFDNEINFLPQETKPRKIQDKKGSKPLTRSNIPYTKPERSFPKEREPQKKFQQPSNFTDKAVFNVSSKTAAPVSSAGSSLDKNLISQKKPNFFKKVSAFVNKFLKPKNKKTLINKLDKPFEKPAALDQPAPNKVMESAAAKPVQLSPELNAVKDIPKVSSIVPPKKEMPPNKAEVVAPSKESSLFTAPAVSKTDYSKETAVNLMPDNVAVDENFKNKILIMASGIAVVGVILALSFLGIHLYGRYSASDSFNTQKELLDIEKEIAVYEKYRLESNILAEKIDLTFDLIKAHKHWSKLFPVLESITHADVLYSNFLGDVSGQITLSPSAPDFKVLAQQILILKNSGGIIDDFDVSEIGLAGSGSSDSSVSGAAFNLSLKFNPDFFLSLENQP